MNVKLHFWISEKDRERLELIGRTHGISMSAAARMAIRAMALRLGLNKDEDLKKLSTDK